MMLFGRWRRRRQLAELSLWCRGLGLMLRNGVDLVAALSVLERQDFAREVRLMTAEMTEQAAAGMSIQELVLVHDDVLPPICIFALQTGQAAERIPETLLALADCLAQGADLGMALVAESPIAADDGRPASTVGQAPVVRMVNRMLTDALTQGASQIGLSPSEGGDSFEISFEIDGSWEPIAEVPIDLFGSVSRRICVMAQINWWSKEPTLGTLTVGHGGAEVVGSVRFIPGETEDAQQLYVTFREAPPD